MSDLRQQLHTLAAKWRNAQWGSLLSCADELDALVRAASPPAPPLPPLPPLDEPDFGEIEHQRKYPGDFAGRRVKVDTDETIRRERVARVQPATPQGWQPIKTMPHGHSVLVTDGHDVQMTCIQPHSLFPTYWMPLPAAPATPQEKG